MNKGISLALALGEEGPGRMRHDTRGFLTLPTDGPVSPPVCLVVSCLFALSCFFFALSGTWYPKLWKSDGCGSLVTGI